jgi:hypothetical protein
MLKVSQQALGPHAAHVLVSEPALVDVYERPEDGRRARTYRFVYRSDRLALSRDRAIQLNAVVCKAIEENLLLDHRNPVHPSTETDDDPSASPDTRRDSQHDMYMWGHDSTPGRLTEH